MSDTVKKVLELIRAHINTEGHVLDMNTYLVEDLYANGSEMVSLLTALEKAFRIHIDDEEAAELITIGDVVGLIQSKVS